jgi:hypothetical protein
MPRASRSHGVSAMEAIFYETLGLVQRHVPEVDVAFIERWYRHRRLVNGRPVQTYAGVSPDVPLVVATAGGIAVNRIHCLPNLSGLPQNTAILVVDFNVDMELTYGI